MLPIAMLGGIVLHNYMHYLSPFSPYLIALMLFFTYCRLELREIRITSFSWYMLLIQIGVPIALFFIIRPFNEIIAQTAFICIFAPTATAAPVITGMLGGSISKLVTFSLISNCAVALLAPVCFTFIEAHGHSADLSFMHITGLISIKIIPIILGPLVLALILKWISPKAHKAIAEHQTVSFYIWAVSLFIVVGNAVSYVIAHLRENGDDATMMTVLALISLVTCCFQFLAGRRIGKLCGDKIAGAQGLGQKNTVLAIWMALTFMNPVSSIGPAAYVAWQNTINSLQIWFKTKKQAIRA